MQTGENSPARTQTGAVGSGVWRRPGRGRGCSVLLQQVLHWWPLPHPLPCPVPPSPPSFSLPPHSGLAVGTLASPAHRIGAAPRKGSDLYQVAPGPQAGPAPALGYKSNYSPLFVPLLCVLPIPSAFCHFTSPLGTARQPFLPPRSGELNFPCRRNFHLPTPGMLWQLRLHSWGQARGGLWKRLCFRIPEAKLISECLHSTLKVWRAI